jgi:DNA mismatch repair protein MSH6
LEVESFQKNKTKGSLFDYLDRCKTHFGRRLLKKWICSPMASIVQINDRLDAIEDLI